jgi:two-component system cell cycle sensor histidine kinase/response regulator CckA
MASEASEASREQHSARIAAADLISWRQAVNASGEVVFMTDRGGVITFVNPEFVRLYGYTAEEVVGRATPRILKSGRTTDATYDRLWQGLIGGDVVRGELINRTKRGDLVHVEFSANPVRDGQNALVGFLAIQRDVTDRKQMEAAIQKSEARYRTLAEGAHDYIFIIGLDGRYEYMNAAAAAMFNLQPSDIVGRHLCDCFPPAMAATLEAEVRQVCEKRAPLYVEQPMNFPQGETWQSAWLAPIFDARQHVTAVMGISRDITERRRLAALVERQNSLLNAIIESSPIGIAVLDGESFVCSTVNPALQRFVPDRRMAGLPFKDVWPGDVTATMRMFERVLGTATPAESVNMQLPACSPIDDGSPCFSVTMTASRLLLPGSTVPSVLVLVTDMTTQKQLEAQFFQAQKMEAVGRLAGGIAHDFNNLLTSILGYSELLKDSLDPGDRRREEVEEIRRAGQCAAALTRQLLTFSRRHVAEPTVIDMNAIVTQFDKILRRTVGEDIIVSLRLEPALNRIKMDAGQLEQILMNLSVNARDAMPRGGALTIETANVDIRTDDHGAQSQIPPGRYVALAITDTGMGMSQEVQSHLFEPFFTTKEVGKGTGLGLSTVFGIVKQHEGGIGVVSKIDRGTTFTVYFPQVERHDPVAIEETPAEPPPPGRETILIAEDNDGLRALAARTLTDCGYHTIAARDAREAMQLSSECDGPIHLLVTDVVMPGPDGLELSRELTRARTETRVLYMSGYSDSMMSDHGLAGRSVAFLQKPFSRDALARKVRQVLEAPKGAAP